MKTVYMDESGYTGYDLLNQNQPFQGASSLIIDENTAKSLVNNYFPHKQGAELKHKKLSKRKGYWKSLLEIQKVILNEFSGLTYVCDKKYLLILRFLDDCVEPFFYDNGIDFFKDGNNYALSSLFYYTAQTLWGKKRFDDLLFFYQRASKNKSILNVNILIDHAKSLLGKDLSHFLLPLAKNVKSCTKDILKPDNNTDIVFIVILSLISRLEEVIFDRYEIIHDTSKKLKTYKKAIERLIENKNKRSFKATEICTMNFPLKLQSVRQQDSKTSYAIQLADLLIGGAIEHCMTLKGFTKKNDYNQNVMQAYGNNNLLFLFPSTDFEDNRQFRKDNQNAEFVDFIAKLLS